jgi:hypothetical protein
MRGRWGEVIDEIVKYRSKPTMKKLWQGKCWVRKRRNREENE